MDLMHGPARRAVSMLSGWDDPLALMLIFSASLLPSGYGYIKWMNQDPVALVEDIGRFFSLEGLKKMLDKSKVTFRSPRSQIYSSKQLPLPKHSFLIEMNIVVTFPFTRWGMPTWTGRASTPQTGSAPAARPTRPQER